MMKAQRSLWQGLLTVGGYLWKRTARLSRDGQQLQKVERVNIWLSRLAI
jgi:hypothetical protein